MKEKDASIGRRKFLSDVGMVAALSSVVVPSQAKAGSALLGSGNADTQEKPDVSRFPQVPKRKLGKTGVEVPIVGLGTVFIVGASEGFLTACLRYGVNFWDVASNYSGGMSERAIGEYLTKNPDVRETLFLASKTDDLRTPLPVIATIEQELKDSLERLKTDYLDLYCPIHALKNPGQLTDELKEWVADKKKLGVIKYCGFSVHANMTENLLGAAKCGWIDVILTNYNFDLMRDDEYRAAIDACYNAGIGLVAMKTQRRTPASMTPMKLESEADKKFTGHFLERGYTEGQAKLKAVLEDGKIASAIIGMKDIDILTTNVAAALDKKKLTREDKAALREYAQATCDRYCPGCAHICDAAVPQVPYVSDIMRYMIYYNDYGQKKRARGLFARLPRDVRNRLLSTDYSLAETRCPRNLPITKIVAEAVHKLA